MKLCTFAYLGDLNVHSNVHSPGDCGFPGTNRSWASKSEATTVPPQSKAEATSRIRKGLRWRQNPNLSIELASTIRSCLGAERTLVGEVRKDFLSTSSRKGPAGMAEAVLKAKAPKGAKPTANLGSTSETCNARRCGYTA